jgi:hypothetical protein
VHALAINIIVTNNDDARALLVKRVQPEWWSRLGPVLVEESVRSLCGACESHLWGKTQRVDVLQQGLRQQLTGKLRRQGRYNYNALDTTNGRCVKTGEPV